jgi:glutamate synthase (ferredoxin)
MHSPEETALVSSPATTRPGKQGLYDPANEHDACGFGFVADIQGRKSNAILRNAIEVLKNLDHRGACGCEVNTGDGAGVLMQMPHGFLKDAAKDAHITLPEPGRYACGLIFMPRNPTQRRRIEEVFARVVQAEGQVYLGARTVPVDNSMLGETARQSEPFIRQVFIERGEDTPDEAAFERKLYVIRKRAYNEIRVSTVGGAEYWYVASLSHKTLVYKGMLTTMQLDQYFPDLRDPRMETAIALVHSRFSTNTFPSWDRAHPYRYIAHNGEINTLRGNINWMRAREALLESSLFGEDVSKITPIVNVNGSDSSMFDNVLELMVLSGRSLPRRVGRSINSTRVSWSLGTGPLPSRSPMVCASVPYSIAMVCGRVATTLRVTTWWSSPPRLAYSTFLLHKWCARVVYNPAVCS